VARFEDTETRRRLDWQENEDGGALIVFRIAMSQAGSARPIEVVRALFDEAIAVDTDLARVGLWAADGADPLRAGASPLHLELLSSAGAAAAVSPPS
jgi:hypothetical protein